MSRGLGKLQRAILDGLARHGEPTLVSVLLAESCKKPTRADAVAMRRAVASLVKREMVQAHICHGIRGSHNQLLVWLPTQHLQEPDATYGWTPHERVHPITYREIDALVMQTLRRVDRDEVVNDDSDYVRRSELKWIEPDEVPEEWLRRTVNAEMARRRRGRAGFMDYGTPITRAIQRLAERGEIVRRRAPEIGYHTARGRWRAVRPNGIKLVKVASKPALTSGQQTQPKASDSLANDICTSPAHTATPSMSKADECE